VPRRHSSRDDYRVPAATPFAAFSTSAATAFGWDTYTAWLAFISMTVDRALRHGTLCVGRDHPVLARHHVPAWFRSPRRCRDGPLKCVEAPADLGVSHERSDLRADVGGKCRPKLRTIREEIAGTIGQGQDVRRPRQRSNTSSRRTAARPPASSLCVECHVTARLHSVVQFIRKVADSGRLRVTRV